jgi:hypothetical protein
VVIQSIYVEMIRWALDLHGADYVDKDVPFGLHLWETLESKPTPATNVPVLRNQKNEVKNY